jgi:hypothetical protein
VAHTFNVDTLSPAVSIDRPAKGDTTNLMTFDGAVGTVPGDVRTVTVKLYAGSDTSVAPLQTLSDGPASHWSVVAQPVQAGDYTVTAEQTDAAGNVGLASSAFTVPNTLLAAGDIGYCGGTDDEATAALVAQRAGTVAPLGDNAYENGTAQEYQDCYGPSWGPFLLRTQPTPGNHEYKPPDGPAGYFGYFGAGVAGPDGKGYYSYDLPPWHIVVLNTSNDCFPISCDATKPQETWLRADLAAHPAKCTLAYFHHPRFTSDPNVHDDAHVQPLWQALYDNGVDLVLNGHAHNYERFDPQTPAGLPDPLFGITEIVAGTGGRSHFTFGTNTDANSAVRNDDTFGILDLTLKADSYSWSFVPAPGGKDFTDSGSANCHDAPP